VANKINWSLLGENWDVGNHIAWLEQELSSIEKSGGVAFIIGHI
jgi:hypothetical protein